VYKVLVFGNGGLWSVIKEYIDFTKVKVVAFINSDDLQKNKYFEGSPIITPYEIADYVYDFIILASGHYDALMQQTSRLNIEKGKIISFKLNDSRIFRSLQDYVNHSLQEVGNYDKFRLLAKHEIDSFYLCNMNLIGRQRRVDFDNTSVDFIRLSSLELIAEEINSKGITGNVAELGVYKGEFAKHINNLFPHRKLYLFDTFEGFDHRDVQADIENKHSVKTTQFEDTSVDLVISKMKYPENIILRKGYFPDTALGVEDKFAFVSIDTDLFKPTYDGLNYFYPRLVEGGYIFVHDYNNFIYKGIKEAIRRFCTEQRISYVPISDNLGTVVLSK
jgi:hypothetical protein